MQFKLNDGICMVQGTCTKDAEMVIRGEKNTHITSFSLAVGKRQDTTTIFANCKAFGRLADCTADIIKGDSVLCIGRIESREYNGKTYTDLICDWVSVAGKGASQKPPAPAASSYVPPTDNVGPVYGKQTELRDYDAGDDDDDLPF